MNIRACIIRCVCAAGFTIILGHDALALGRLELETASFLRSSDERGNTSALLRAGPRTHGNAFWKLSGHLEADVFMFVDDPSSFSIEAQEAYLTTDGRLSGLHRLALGRKLENWSELDRVWKTGIWNPRFVWNPSRPELVGMTGLFYGYSSRKWKLTAFASPIAIPERGTPLSSKDGKVVGAGPYFIPPQDKLLLGDRLIDIRYDIQLPDLGEILLRPGASISFAYGRSKGVWVRGSYGFLPVHQPDIQVESAINPSGMFLDTTLHGAFYHHHVGTLETGYRAKSWSLWASATGDVPTGRELPQSWVGVPVGPSLITGWGGELDWFEGFSFSAAFLSISEFLDSEEDPLSEGLPARYHFKNAWKIGGTWKGRSPISYSLDWLYDVENTSNLVSLDVIYRPSKAARRHSGGLGIGIGADFITSASRKGWIGQYLGDDRVRGKVTYAF